MFEDCMVVVTTINTPSEALKTWCNKFKVIVIPDKKTPIDSFSNYNFLDLEYNYGIDELPFNHYCRKNLGYIYASKSGVSFILDTDDDTYYDGTEFFNHLGNANAVELKRNCGFVNIFDLLKTENINIWPRGFPLHAIQSKDKTISNKIDKISPSIIQFLINGDTDVDAISRLVLGVRDVNFRSDNILYKIASNNFTPFNSQLTLFTREVFPLLYLPSTVSFRFTDILRSIVAKKIIDRFNLSMCFFDSIGFQIRNEHDFILDFISEIPCYTSIPKIIDILEDIQGEDIPTSMISSYDLLHKNSFIGETDLIILRKFLSHI